MSELRIQDIEGKVFGAVVTGVRLAELDAETFGKLHEALLRRGFLHFPEQFLSEADNVTFGERFGKLEFGALAMANQERLEEGRYGRIYDLDGQRMRTNVGNEAWHTDSTYWPVSSKCAMLSAVVVPATGGETELADARAGYAALPEALKQRIAALSAYHSTQYSQARDLGDFPEQKPNTIYHGEAYLRPLVKVHPETGTKCLFIGRHAFGIPGLSREDSRALLAELLGYVVGDATRVYTHHWQPGDLLLWDNRCLLHRARPYDYGEPRVLIGTRIAGDPVSELAYHPDDPRAEAGRRALHAELELLRAEIEDKRYAQAGPTADAG